jgi:hypothetical protein
MAALPVGHNDVVEHNTPRRTSGGERSERRRNSALSSLGDRSASASPSPSAAEWTIEKVLRSTRPLQSEDDASSEDAKRRGGAGETCTSTSEHAFFVFFFVRLLLLVL